MHLPIAKRVSPLVHRGFPLFLTLLCIASILPRTSTARPHSFEGLPHYNYFEAHPELPGDEFLGRAGAHIFSLVVYNLQESAVGTAGDAHLLLVAFNSQSEVVYGGPLTLEILDRDEVIHSEDRAASDLKSIYALHRKLPDTGAYKMRVLFPGTDAPSCTIPFTLSPREDNWGKWIGASLLLALLILAIGARRAHTASRGSGASRQTTSPKPSTLSLIVATILIALTSHGCQRREPAGRSPGDSSSAPVLNWPATRPTDRGHFTVNLRPADRAIVERGKHFSLEATIEPTAPGQFEVAVNADMPAHRHGMNTEPKLVNQGENRYLIHGMLFHMAGDWVITVEITGPGGPERAIFPVSVR